MTDFDYNELAAAVAAQLDVDHSGSTLYMDERFRICFQPTDKGGNKADYVMAEVLLKDATDDFVPSGWGIHCSRMRKAPGWKNKLADPRLLEKVEELFDECSATGGYVTKPPTKYTDEVASYFESKGWDTDVTTHRNRDEVRFTHVKSNIMGSCIVRDDGGVELRYNLILGDDYKLVVPEMKPRVRSSV